MQGVHPVQVAEWKKQAVDALARLFGDRRSKAAQDEEAKRALLEPDHPAISLVRQCALGGWARGFIYLTAVLDGRRATFWRGRQG